MVDGNLNTSHVSVRVEQDAEKFNIKMNLNTSHVSVRDENSGYYVIPYYKFKYITCIGSRATKIGCLKNVNKLFTQFKAIFPINLKLTISF